MLPERLKPASAALCATLLSVPGATGLLQPRHLNWYGLEDGVDISLVRCCVRRTLAGPCFLR